MYQTLVFGVVFVVAAVVATVIFIERCARSILLFPFRLSANMCKQVTVELQETATTDLDRICTSLLTLVKLYVEIRFDQNSVLCCAFSKCFHFLFTDRKLMWLSSDHQIIQKHTGKSS